MKLKDLQFSYPSDLIAVERSKTSRVLYNDLTAQTSEELTKSQLLSKLQTGDCLVINDTKVLKRRVISKEGFEVLFIENLGSFRWKVLFPASRLKKNQTLILPDGVELTLFEKGIPQTAQLNQELSEEYFEQFGQMAIPPYIQKQRGFRENSSEDKGWYQTEWAAQAGSCAAPTASLHFNQDDLSVLQARGVEVVKVTLHVGLGTFLPIRTDEITEHKMHSEQVYVSKSSLDKINQTKKGSHKIWALGTTVARVLESIPHNYFQILENGDLTGSTELFLYPGVNFEYVDVLMTNFHQPGSSLLALVSAFAGQEEVKKAYEWAIEKQFKLFSYGDLTVWQK